MADTILATLRELRAEAQRAEAVMLRECGMSVLDKDVLERASAAIAAADAAPMADPTIHLDAALACLKAAADSLRAANASAGPVAGILLIPLISDAVGLQANVHTLAAALREEVANG